MKHMVLTVLLQKSGFYKFNKLNWHLVKALALAKANMYIQQHPENREQLYRHK